MKKNDFILIGIILIIAAVFFGYTRFIQSEEGGRVIIYVDKEETASYSLSEDGEYDIKTEKGMNHLVIKDGMADVTEADCPDGLCEKQAKISKNGETIVCLPHLVVVEVVSEEESELDAIAK